jgi:hypothetical protein
METLEETKKNLRRLWGASREDDVTAVRALLESGNVDVHGVDEWVRCFLLCAKLPLGCCAETTGTSQRCGCGM